MKIVKNYPLAFMVIALALATFTSYTSAQPDETAVVRSFIEQVAENIEAGNFAKLDEMYASNRGVHIIEGSGVNHGWLDYRDNHLKPELEAFQNLDYRFFAIEPQIRGEFAFAAFRYEYFRYLRR